MVPVLTTLDVLRRLADVTQEELAEAIGASQASLSAWENGTYRLPERQASKILKVLRPRLRKIPSSELSLGQAHIVQNLKASDFEKPWDEFLVEVAIELTGEKI